MSESSCRAAYSSNMKYDGWDLLIACRGNNLLFVLKRPVA